MLGSGSPERIVGGRLRGAFYIIGVFTSTPVETVALAGGDDDAAEVLGVGLRGEVGVVKAAVIVGDEVREVLPNEAQVGRTGARLEEERIGGKEAGVDAGRVAGHAVDGLFGVGDSGQERRAEDACGDAGLAKAADGVEAEVGAGGAWLEQPGEGCIGRGDGDVDGEVVAAVDLLEQVGVAEDEVGLGDDADFVAGVAGEDFQQAAGDAGTTFDGLPGVGGGTDGNLVGGMVAAQLLLKQPGGVLLEEDEALEGERVVEVGLTHGPRLPGCGSHELVGVTGVAVAAGELAATVGIDAPRHPVHAFGVKTIENTPDLESAELDKVTVVGVSGLEGHSGDADRGLIQDGEERFGGPGNFRHLFAFLKMRIGRSMAVVKGKF